MLLSDLEVSCEFRKERLQRKLKEVTFLGPEDIAGRYNREIQSPKQKIAKLEKDKGERVTENKKYWKLLRRQRKCSSDCIRLLKQPHEDVCRKVPCPVLWCPTAPQNIHILYTRNKKSARSGRISWRRPREQVGRSFQRNPHPPQERVWKSAAVSAAGSSPDWTFIWWMTTPRSEEQYASRNCSTQ